MGLWQWIPNGGVKGMHRKRNGIHDNEQYQTVHQAVHHVHTSRAGTVNPVGSSLIPSQ